MPEGLKTMQNDLPSEIAAINDDHNIHPLSDEDEMPKDHTDRPPEELYAQLIDTIRKYHPSDDMTLVREAYELAYKAHENQLRRSGAPYIIHPLHVAIILAELEMDKESIIAGLLHDVVEDTDTTLEEIEQRFGPDVALLVDGVTKLTRLSLGTTDKLEMQAENLRKMFLSMSKDIRIIIIKLADRLHNMRTLQFQKPEKQREKAAETLDIYAPLASRLGMFRLKMELDNLSLQYLEPEKYAKLVRDIDERSHSREEFVQSIVADVSKHVKEAGINAQVYGRVKHIFSIYKKMVIQQKGLDEIYDLFAVRILVDTVQDCYAALGIIHELYMPIPGRFKDYIAIPKANMYQSLHTTVIGKSGIPFEIQIRTYEMHRTAEYGVAAHWKYKESGSTSVNKEEEKLNWLRQILEWQREMPDNTEFMASVRSDLDIFADTVYCFTPKGDVKNLPAGSTPIDLAYSIHSAVGNKMVGARVNDKLVPIDYRLHNGDRVEIITSQNSRGPSRDWLNIVKSTQARNKINQWFKEQNKEDNIEKGKDLIEKNAKSKGYNLPDLLKPEFMEKVMNKYGCKDWNAVLASVGHGGLKEGQVINKLAEEKRKYEQRHITDEQVLEISQENAKKAVAHAKGGIVVEGLHDLAVHFSRCCSPIPGDEIVGFVTRGRGVSIHRTDCVNIINLPAEDRSRLIEAEWHLPEKSKEERYLAGLVLYVNNRVGMLADISRVLMEMNINITNLSTKVSKQGIATIDLQFQSTGTEEIRGVTAKLKQINGVFDVTRT
ncbi:MAG: bifunctional (p)ppGpp synthetase/guanosine-3',5'-bis(diphosphate) 3'-pyrophosphohydrolase [Lachnospiraceae bacterium]|nr:bifunctional (p)ppGpp synthetase/guanosine-3',5'-bis(diphosphate) 3'-pyrophosphohydrolase [Lachnospiraceae bacterium]